MFTKDNYTSSSSFEYATKEVNMLFSSSLVLKTLLCEAFIVKKKYQYYQVHRNIHGEKKEVNSSASNYYNIY